MTKISLENRLRGAIWGQFIGDAAGLGTQFINSSEDLRAGFPKGIQGFETPQNVSPHAGKKSGDFTHYGDAALLLLQSLIAQRGFSARDFGTRFVETFASLQYPNFVDRCAQETIDNYQLSLEEGHPDLGYEFQGGANNKDIDSATRLAPLLALYWDDPNLMAIVDKATRVTQNNELAVAYMRMHAKITRSLFNGEDLKESFRKEIHPANNDTPLDRHVRSKILLAFDMESQNDESVAMKLGLPSLLDHSFPCAIHAAIKHGQSFTKAVLHTISCGGDGAGRAALIGTWLGAHLGVQAAPEAWRQRLNKWKIIEHDIETLMSIKAHARF